MADQLTRRELPFPNVLRVLLLGVVVKLAALAVFSLSIPSDWLVHLVADVRSWVPFWWDCQHGGVPYVSVPKEYAVAVGLLYWALSPLMDLETGSLLPVLLTHAIVMSIVDVLNAGLFYRLLWRRNNRRALVLALALVALPTAALLAPFRFESVVVLSVLLGLTARERGHPLLATAAWSVGCWLKWYPVFFVAVQVIEAWRLGQRRQAAVCCGLFAAIAVALNLPFIVGALVVNGSLDSWTITYTFHAGRAVSFDTLLGCCRLWLGDVPGGSVVLAGSAALALTVLLVRRSWSFETRCALTCMATLICNQVYSAQFNLWFYPFVLLILAQARDPRWPAVLLLALDLSNVAVYPFVYARVVDELDGFTPAAAADRGGVWSIVFTLAVVFRAGLLFALGLWLARRTAPPLDSGAPSS
ncbi:MAG: hypothetical protein ABIJ09_08280 [Pseudomonadota bacterium]